MKEIFTHAEFTKVGFFRSILEEAQIPCFIRNENSQLMLTGWNIPLFHPVLCITNDEDYDRAKQLVDEQCFPQADGGADWKCPACGEEVPAEFDSCWKCEALRPLNTIAP